MTALAKRQTRLTFETSAEGHYKGRHTKPIIIEAQTPFYCVVRLKGTRTRYPISFSRIFEVAVREAVERKRAERKAARKVRRNA